MLESQLRPSSIKVPLSLDLSRADPLGAIVDMMIRYKVAIMPSQLFAYASDPVLLLSDATGFCLAADLSLVQCTDASAMEWVHIFGERGAGGEIFHVDCSGDPKNCHHMKCLTRIPVSNDTSLRVQPCNASASPVQRWEYDGNNGLIKVPKYQICVITDSAHGTIILGDCADANARWSQYSECKLNTYTRTQSMRVESVESPGWCIRESSLSKLSLFPCFIPFGDWWQYYYDASFARLQKVGTNQCLAREVDNPKEFTGNIENLPTGLMSCGESDVENVAFYRTVLGGEEANVFQWNLINTTTGLSSGPSYCVRVPQQSQQVCKADLVNEMHWRRYDVAADATEISVKPDLLLNKITDPEVLFQFFLFTAEGKSSRKLRAKVAGLQRDMSRLNPIIDSTINMASESLSLAGTVGGRVMSLSDKTRRAETAFNTYRKVLLF
ncbi:hypothetical protein ACHAXR_011908, partial [Thalassiosira sp. AJA248-18]